MAKTRGRKAGTGESPLPVRGDQAGPCAQTDQALADLNSALGPLLALLNGTPPNGTVVPVYNATTGTFSWATFP